VCELALKVSSVLPCQSRRVHGGNTRGIGTMTDHAACEKSLTSIQIRSGLGNTRLDHQNHDKQEYASANYHYAFQCRQQTAALAFDKMPSIRPFAG
jgi:hypothetical protein